MAEPRSSLARQPLLRKERGACETSLPGPTLGAGPGAEIEGCGLREVRIVGTPLHTECARSRILFAKADSVDVTSVQLIN